MSYFPLKIRKISAVISFIFVDLAILSHAYLQYLFTNFILWHCNIYIIKGPPYGILYFLAQQNSFNKIKKYRRRKKDWLTTDTSETWTVIQHIFYTILLSFCTMTYDVHILTTYAEQKYIKL